MSQLSIRLQGYPEKVQRVADALDDAFPDMVAWDLSEDLTDGITIKLEGLEKPSMPVQGPQASRTAERRLAALPWHTSGDAGFVRVPGDRMMMPPARIDPETSLAAVPSSRCKRGVVIAILALHPISAGRDSELAVFIADEIATMLSRIRGVSVVSYPWPGGDPSSLKSGVTFPTMPAATGQPATDSSQVGGYIL